MSDTRPLPDDDPKLKDPNHPSVPLVRGMTREMQEAINTALGAAVRKASPWSISMGLLLVIMLAGGAGFLYFTSDFWLAWQKNGLDFYRLTTDHEHCVKEVQGLKTEVQALQLEVHATRNELLSIKAKNASVP